MLIKYGKLILIHEDFSQELQVKEVNKTKYKYVISVLWYINIKNWFKNIRNKCLEIKNRRQNIFFKN